MSPPFPRRRVRTAVLKIGHAIAGLVWRCVRWRGGRGQHSRRSAGPNQANQGGGTQLPHRRALTGWGAPFGQVWVLCVGRARADATHPRTGTGKRRERGEASSSHHREKQPGDQGHPIAQRVYPLQGSVPVTRLLSRPVSIPTAIIVSRRVLELDVCVLATDSSLSAAPTTTTTTTTTMIAATARPNDENSSLAISHCLSEKVPANIHPSLTTRKLIHGVQELPLPPPPPPPLRKSRKHRPAPLDLSPQRQHLSPLDSNNPNAIEEYLFSPSPATALSLLGMPSPAHYSQTDLLHILDSNPPLTPVPPLRTTASEDTVTGLGVQVDDAPPLSPGLPPASHTVDPSPAGPVDDIFVELVATEDSFVVELNTMERMVAELLVPMDIVSREWLDVVQDLTGLHVRFVRDLNSDGKTGITPSILNTILHWVPPP